MLMYILLFLILFSTVCVTENCVCVGVDADTEEQFPGLNSAIIEALVEEGFGQVKANPLKKYLENVKHKVTTAGILRFGRSLRKDTQSTVRQNWSKQGHPYAQSMQLICTLCLSAIKENITELEIAESSK